MNESLNTPKLFKTYYEPRKIKQKDLNNLNDMSAVIMKKIFQKTKKNCPICRTRIDISGHGVGDEVKCSNCETDILIESKNYKPILAVLQINIVGL